MYKKRVQILTALFISVLLILIVLIVDVNTRKYFGIPEIQIDQLQDLLQGKKEVFVLDKKLLINGEKVPYDKKEKIFYITQSLSESNWQGLITLKDKEPSEKVYLIAPQKDKLEAMASNSHYQICYTDDEKKVFQVCDVIISGLPIMDIVGNEMTLFSASEKNVSAEKSDIAYEVRGASSYYYEKKSYNLKLVDEKKSLLGLRTDDDWILSALYDDIGLIHNQLSYQLWNEVASLEKTKGNYAVNQEYIELLMDGEYLGVYALSERGDTKQFMMSDNDILFKVKGFPYDEGKGVIDLKYPNETSLETDSLKNSFMEHFCEDNEIPLRDSLILIDYENALDYSLFCQIATAADNTIKNSFLVGRRTGEYYKLCEIPWDCNMTWGIKSYVLTSEDRIYDTEFMSLVIRKLYKKDPEKINTDIANRWFYLRDSVFSEKNIKAILDENFLVLHRSGAYERNYCKWPTISLNTGEKDDLSDVSFSDIEKGEYVKSTSVQEIWDDEKIYNFVEKRLAVLDEYYKQFLDVTE